MIPLAATIALACGLAGPLHGDEVAPAPPTAREADQDCGVRSLCLLLGLEGRTFEPKEVVRSLPKRDPAGYSMKQLRDEAARRGVPLRGVKLRPGQRPAGPSIVFLGDGGHGHYVVVRPIGHTGKLVQVLDPNDAPIVLDAELLDRLPRWTGLALVPDPPRWPLRIGAALVAAGVPGLGANLWLRRNRGRVADDPRDRSENLAPIRAG